MTKQEIFNVVWERAKDKRKAWDNGLCMYRMPLGNGESLKCFAGVLIPDDMYDPNMERATAHPLMSMYPELKPYLIPSDGKAGFIRSLQGIHDDFRVEEWDGMLRMFAENDFLTVPE